MMSIQGHCIRPWCPVCGVFGRRARRRARRHADAALVRFHACLARDTRRERVLRMMGDAPPWQRQLAVHLVDMGGLALDTELLVCLPPQHGPGQ